MRFLGRPAPAPADDDAGGDGTEQPVDLFTPPPRAERAPLPRRPALPAAGARSPGGDRTGTGTLVPVTGPRAIGVRLHTVLLVAALAIGVLGGTTISLLTATASASAPALPAVPAPAAPVLPPAPTSAAAATTDATAAPAGAGVTAQPDPVGASVQLPGPGSRDWVAPGVSPDGELVRAELAEESIEFRAADTRPGRVGPFAVSWSGGVAPEPAGSAAGMLGVRPGGWVQFVVRSDGLPGDLVMHLAGNVAVSVATAQATRTTTVSATAQTVTVALDGQAGTTVTVAPAAATDIGVVSAELR